MRHSAVRRPFAAIAAAIVLALAAGAVPAEPARIGTQEFTSIGTTHPYAATLSGHRSWEVSWPGATYIRIHFDAFDLAPGDRLVLRDPEGSQSYEYSGRGPGGSGSFWANTIAGDLAILELHADTGGGYGFDVDTFGRGDVPLFGDDGDTIDSVCGVNDWQDVACYETSHPTEYEKARGAVKAIIGCCSSCTAFKVSNSGQFMTNNHCTSSQSGVASTELLFEYQNASCGGGGAGTGGSVFGDTMLATDYTLDYTLMTSNGDSGAIPCLAIDARLAPAGERIYIPGHPSGGPKKLSIESTENGGVCQVDSSPHPGRDLTSDIGYYCDTTNGSSGSPVLSGETHAVVAIHHFGGCLNSGARMDRIHAQISGLLDSCDGSGGPGPGPTCGQVDEACNDHADCCDGLKCKGGRSGKVCR